MGLALILWVLLAQGPPGAAQWEASYRSGVAAFQDYDFQAALRDLRKSLEYAERFGEADPRLADTLAQLAKACNGDDDCEGASQYLTRALKLRAGIHAPDARRADTLVLVAEAASDLGQYDDALKCYQEAVELRERSFSTRHQKVADIYAAIAWVYQWKEQPEKARETSRHAVSIVEESGAIQTAGFAMLLEERGGLFGAQEDEKGALPYYERAIAIRTALWKPADPRFVQALSRIAAATQHYKDAGYAEQLYRRAVDIQLHTHSIRSREYLEAQAALATFLDWKQRWQDAETAHGDALRSAEALHDETVAAEHLYHISRARNMTGRAAEAVEPAERALEIRKRTTEQRDSWERAQTRSLLVEIHAALGDFARAEEQLRTLQEEAPAGQVIAAAETLGDTYQKLGRFVDAVPKFELAAAVYEARVSSNSQQMVDKLMRLSQAYQLAGLPTEANRVAIRASQLQWSIASKQLGGKGIALVMGIVAMVFLVGAVLLVLLQWLFARHLGRKIARLYEAPAPLVCLEVAVPSSTGTEMAVLVETAPPPPPVPAPVRRMAFHGEGGALFAIRIANLLLSIVTVGIYYFWGKAKVRRYVYNQTEFEGDRLEFHGTGKEMLLGWLKGLPVLAFIVLFPRVLPLVWQNPKSILVSQLAIFAAIALLWPVARAGAYRYRMNRTSWRGIRFSFRGSTWGFLLLSLKGYALTALTLGIYYPFFAVRARRYLMDQTWFGNAPFRFEGRGGDLLPSFMTCVPLAYSTLGIGWLWWSALRDRYNWAYTLFAGARCRCTVTAWKLFRLWTGNVLLLVLTLTLAAPWVIVRTMRFWTENVELVGDVDLAAINQDARTTSAVGEGFADFLGFDFGL
jgi:uncharacterized membrane protein YjgN (DUF898 family)/tetratricopeptide (TPR) repeat protein